MSKKGQNQNVRAVARQLVLSGLRNSVQPQDIYSDGTAQEPRRQETAKGPDWQSKVYNLSFTIQLTEVSVDGDKHVYSISLNDDAHLSLCAVSARSKKATSSAVTVPQAKSKSKTLAMVYGVHKTGELSFSPATRSGGIDGIATVYSWLLGQVDDAVQFRLQQLEDSQRNDDPGKRTESASSQKDVGKHQETGRGDALRAEVLPKTLPEETPILVETNRQVLGKRSRNK